MTVSDSNSLEQWLHDLLKHHLIALSVTIEGDELVIDVGTNDTLRGGSVPLNTWAQIAVQYHGNRMVEL